VAAGPVKAGWRLVWTNLAEVGRTLASGEAARAGVDDRCRNEPMPVLRGLAEHHGACFLTDESVRKGGGSRVGR
jgi:hypothetical protein